jgi:hypothetical protein
MTLDDYIAQAESNRKRVVDSWMMDPVLADMDVRTTRGMVVMALAWQEVASARVLVAIVNSTQLNSLN